MVRLYPSRILTPRFHSIYPPSPHHLQASPYVYRYAWFVNRDNRPPPKGDDSVFFKKVPSCSLLVKYHCVEVARGAFFLLCPIVGLVGTFREILTRHPLRTRDIAPQSEQIGAYASRPVLQFVLTSEARPCPSATCTTTATPTDPVTNASTSHAATSYTVTTPPNAAKLFGRRSAKSQHHIKSLLLRPLPSVMCLC